MCRKSNFDHGVIYQQNRKGMELKKRFLNLYFLNFMSSAMRGDKKHPRHLWGVRKYSQVPKERHVRKESNGNTLGLCVVPKESHD